jgi:hypothetical protein
MRDEFYRYDLYSPEETGGIMNLSSIAGIGLTEVELRRFNLGALLFYGLIDWVEIYSVE